MRHTGDPETNGCQEGLGERRADQAVKDALHGLAHNREQAPGARSGESFGDFVHVVCHLPAVALEEKSDKYTQTEFEKGDAEHCPAGYGDVGGRADQPL